MLGLWDWGIVLGEIYVEGRKEGRKEALRAVKGFFLSLLSWWFLSGLVA